MTNIEHDFRKAVLERAAAIVAERMADKVEEAAQAQAEEALRQLGLGNGCSLPLPLADTPAAKVAHVRRGPRKYGVLPRNVTLVRGSAHPSSIYHERSAELRVALLAWNSLHSDGHFKSGRAERMDLTRYLSESLPDLGLTSFSSWITRMVRNNVLAVLPPGF